MPWRGRHCPGSACARTHAARRLRLAGQWRRKTLGRHTRAVLTAWCRPRGAAAGANRVAARVAVACGPNASAAAVTAAMTTVMAAAACAGARSRTCATTTAAGSTASTPAAATTPPAAATAAMREDGACGEREHCDRRNQNA